VIGCFDCINLRGEVVDGKDAGRAGSGGEVGELAAAVRQRLQAVITKTNVLLGLVEGVGRGGADGHAESLKSVSNSSTYSTRGEEARGDNVPAGMP